MIEFPRIRSEPFNGVKWWLGRLPEWLIGAALKADGPQGHEGSNPSPSVDIFNKELVMTLTLDMFVEQIKKHRLQDDVEEVPTTLYALLEYRLPDSDPEDWPYISIISVTMEQFDDYEATGTYSGILPYVTRVVGN